MKMRKNYSANYPQNSGGTAQPETATPAMTMDELEKELAEPRQLATDTPSATAENNDAAAAEAQPAPQPETFTEKVKGIFHLPAPPPEEPEPVAVFPSDAPEDKSPGEAKPPIPREKVERNLAYWLKMRDRLQQWGFSRYTGSDKALFAFSEDDFEILKDAYYDTAETLTAKLPPWINIAMAEATVMGPKIAMATELREVNKENERLKAKLRDMEAGPQHAAGTPAKSVAQKQRTRFSIDDKGYYQYTVNGKYVKQDKRTEKASMADIDKIVEINDAETVKAAFGLSDDEISKLYPDE